MKNHKNLSKQELMEQQPAENVYSGGKFVSKTSKTDASHGAGRKRQAEKILATVVMGMNLVNAAAPVAALAAAEQITPTNQPQRSQAQPLDYAVLPQLADVVDRAIFASAEATDYTGNASVASMGNGDVQYIVEESGTVNTMGGGEQNIAHGGTGTVNTMSGGTQFIDSAGIGMVGTISGGSQVINHGGIGYVGVLDDGRHDIYSGAKGTIITMNGGTQNIDHDGIGSINTMSGGTQKVWSRGTGTIDTMSDGEQNISSGGTGMIGTMSGGLQNISSGGMGMVDTMMSNGEQNISSGGTGTINTMSDGTQNISAGGTGMIDTMSGGGQYVDSNVIGTVNTMSGGHQYINAGGTGMIGTMSGGSQYILSSGGMGTIDTMNGGEQRVQSGGTVIVNTMNGGMQGIHPGGTGTVNTMNGGMQDIVDGGTGTVSSLNGGTQNISSGGTSLATTINGGTQTVRAGGIVSGAVLSAGLQQVHDGTNLNDITFAGGTQAVMSGAVVDGMQVAAGVQQVNSGGTATNTEVTGGVMQLASGGNVSGLTLSGGRLELATINGGSFALGDTTTANGGLVNMTASSLARANTPAYENLAISDLAGSGTTFRLDANLAGAGSSDTITIATATGGTHYIQIKDWSGLSGSTITGSNPLKLITDTQGNLNFEGKEFNAGGLFVVDPTLAKNGSDWYLTSLSKTANNDTAVLLDAADNSYALWRNTNDSLRSRLGSLASGSQQADGIWARTQTGRFGGDNYEGRYNMYQLGYDKADNAKSIYGMAVDYGDGTGSYTDGSGKDKLKTFSLYGVWTGDNGTYTNVTARAGTVSTDLESYGDYPDKASYKQHAYSVSVEYGKRFDMAKGMFFEPNAQFTLGRLGSIDYTTDRGANGHIDGMNSAIGRIGFVMGQKITGGSDIYLKADLLHEFAGERDLVLTSDLGGTHDVLTTHNDYGDTWFELGLGGSVKLSKAGNLYGEVVRGFGGDINKKWSLNAGLRFTF